MIKAIIFDAFGVIYPEWADYYRKCSPEKSMDALFDVFEQGDLGKISEEEYIDKVSQLMRITADELDATRYTKTTPDEDVLSYASSLKNQGKIALLSNASGVYFRKLVERDGLDDIFDEIIISGEVGSIKPQLKIYQIAIKKLKCRNEETIFIDDRIANVEAAIEIGMHGIVYHNLKQVKEKVNEINHENSDN